MSNLHTYINHNFETFITPAAAAPVTILPITYSVVAIVIAVEIIGKGRTWKSCLFLSHAYTWTLKYHVYEKCSKRPQLCCKMKLTSTSA